MSSSTGTSTCTSDDNEEEPKHYSVGFIGAGMMAQAVMDGIITNDVVEGPDAVSCSDVFDEPLEKCKEKGIYATKCNQEVCKRSKDVICIAVKPHVVKEISKEICKELGNPLEKRKHKSSTAPLIISLAAGITLETLEENLPGHRVIRVMPNTCCMVGQSASGFSCGKLCTEKDRTIVHAIFGSVGICYEMKQVLLNAVTGLSGSGPAYVFEFIEALADGGVRVGLPRNEALQLAAQTVKGAAEMVLQTGVHPATLKDRVCSPGGTTIAGIDELEKGGLRSTTIQAVKAATRRSHQLGGASEEDIKNKYNL